MKTGKSDRGSLTIEVVVSLLLLITLTLCLLSAMQFHGRSNRILLVRQQCISAAQAQLDSLTIDKKPLEPETCERLWPGLVFSIEKTPGQRQWAGLELYKVNAAGRVGKRTVSVQTARYIRTGE